MHINFLELNTKIKEPAGTIHYTGMLVTTAYSFLTVLV